MTQGRNGVARADRASTWHASHGRPDPLPCNDPPSTLFSRSRQCSGLCAKVGDLALSFGSVLGSGSPVTGRAHRGTHVLVRRALINERVLCLCDSRVPAPWLQRDGPAALGRHIGAVGRSIVARDDASWDRAYGNCMARLNVLLIGI